jgi:predicted phosphodiesterase
MSPSRRRKLTLLAALAVGAVAGAAALSLVPGSDHRVGPATMRAKAHAGAAQTVLVVPPLGTVRARTHPVPFSVELSLAQLDIRAVQEIVGDPQRRANLQTQIEDDLRSTAMKVALRSVVIALIGGAIAGALLPWRRWADVAAGAAGGLLISALAVLGVALSFDIEGFEEPTYTGALTRAPGVLRTLEQQQLSLSAVDSRFETAATRLSELLALVAEPSTDPREDTVAVLHVSDIHSNPLGISVTQQLARTFDVDAVVDSGDLTSFGEAIETNVARRVERMDRPYIFVPGNHDSAGNQRRLDEIDNVHLLHDDTFDVKGITFFGWRDPTFTVWDAISTEEGNELRSEEGVEIASALEELSSVDVLVVHDRRMGEASEGLVPLVLSGHTHERDVTQGEDTSFLTVGSTGATGLEFFIEGSRPYEAEIVYFRADDPVAVDYVTFEALGDEFEIDRQQLAD